MRNFENIIGLIVIILFFLFLYIVLPSGKDVASNLNIDFSDKEIEGIIVDKFIDRSEHSYPIIIINLFKKDSVVRINFVRESTNAFDSLEISDSIYKQKNKMSIIRKRKGNSKIIGPILFK